MTEPNFDEQYRRDCEVMEKKRKRQAEGKCWDEEDDYLTIIKKITEIHTKEDSKIYDGDESI